MPISAQKPETINKSPCVAMEDKLTFVDYLRELNAYVKWADLGIEEKTQIIGDFLTEESNADFELKNQNDSELSVSSNSLPAERLVNLLSIEKTDQQITELLNSVEVNY